jgi:hypothetical protein
MGNRMVEQALMAGKECRYSFFLKTHVISSAAWKTRHPDHDMVCTGMSHVLAGHAASVMDEVEELVIMVGGLR